MNHQGNEVTDHIGQLNELETSVANVCTDFVHYQVQTGWVHNSIRRDASVNAASNGQARWEPVARAYGERTNAGTERECVRPQAMHAARRSLRSRAIPAC